MPQSYRKQFTSEMAEKSAHTSTFPELHRLYHSPTLPHILGSTILAQNIFKDPALLVHKNSSQTSLNSSSASEITPKKPILSHERNPGARCIVHGSSHVISLLAAAPFERVYMLMQCQNELLKHGYLSSPYKGMKDCLLRTIKHEGVLSLWRGSSINVITPLAFQAYIYASIQLNRDRTDSTSAKKVNSPPLWFPYLSGVFGILIRYPLDYARTRLANDVKAAQKLHFSLDSSGKNYSYAAGSWKFNGVIDVYKKTLQSEGIIGLYRGCTFACIGILASTTAGVIVYKHNEIQRKDKPNEIPVSRFLTTPLALLSFSVACYPAFTISHRMMMTSGETTKYNGAMDAVRQIVRYEGVSSLYKGLPAFLMHYTAKNVVMFAYCYLVFFGLLKQLETSS